MEALYELHEGLSALKDMLGALPPESPHWNEAQNRFQFIDELLTKALGWHKPHIAVEEQVEGGRADYFLGKPANAVLEAKKEAKRFSLPPSSREVRSLRAIHTACPVARAAIEQVQTYCAQRGIPIAAVCNGPQLIVFQAITLGSSPFDGQCFVFDGFDQYIEHFPLLWKILSPESVHSNLAQQLLTALRHPRMPPKASTAIPDPLRHRYRNAFTESLQHLSSLLLEDIEAHPDIKSAFYRECYVDTAANHRHLLLSSRIVESWYSRADDGNSGFANPEIEMRASDRKEISIGANVLAEALSRKPIVILGDVGVGKTSFFENLFEKIREAHSEKSLLVHIDLGSKAALTENLRTYLIQASFDQIYNQSKVDVNSEEFVRAAYYQQVGAFERSVHGSLKKSNPLLYEQRLIDHLHSMVNNSGQHLHAVFGHLSKGRNTKIIIVLDNADQRDYDTQQSAFVIAQELASSGNALVFVALRPSTFHQSKLTGALSGYENRVFAITPPPAEVVIEKRLTFAARVAEGKIAPEAVKQLKLDLSNIVAFINATLRSIRDNQSIRTFLSNISSGNVRQVVELVNGFFGSPNVDSKKIIEIEIETGSYKIPLHEFTKHALLGEYSYYNPQSSQVACNVYDVRESDIREHFLRPLIVSFLSSEHAFRNKDGYSQGKDVILEMRSHGFTDDQTRSALRRLAEHRLVATPHQHFREVTVADNHGPDEFYFRVTSTGAYHVKYWMTAFGFLDAMAIDTPIFNDELRDKVFQLASSFEISDRLTKSEVFREYLRQAWTSSQISCSYFDFDALIKANDVSFDPIRNVVSKPKKPHRW